MRKFSRHQPVSPHLPLLKAIQAHFGLTQEFIADVLGVSRATLSQYSLVSATGNVRGLPLAAMLRLLAIQQVLPAPHGPATPPAEPAGGPTPTPVLPAYDQQTLSMRRQQIGLQQYRLQKQLGRCELHLSQARLRQQVLPALRAAFEPADELTQNWLAWFEQDAAHILKEEAPAATLLELRLRVLAFEAAEIAKLLAVPAA